ncbi:MAG: hypothetical protein GVY36_17180 [Verrucomicrobia bacterium]|jgi:hypothetical protein|nr:hypothetical protein [Verrucomicrobiota bacterium]
MQSLCSKKSRTCSGFSLIEVVLAIGIFLVTVLALVGLLGPTLKSVDDVEKSDEISSVVNTVNAFLQSSPDIAPNGSKFDAIYDAVKGDNYATIFVFRQFVSDTSVDVRLQVGFAPGESTAGTAIDPLAEIPNFNNAAGPVYRVVLSASSVLPTPTGETTKYRSLERTNGVYELNASLADYDEGYFAMEVRIYAEDWRPGFDPSVFPQGSEEAVDLETLDKREPDFTYNTAIVR